MEDGENIIQQPPGSGVEEAQTIGATSDEVNTVDVPPEESENSMQESDESLQNSCEDSCDASSEDETCEDKSASPTDSIILPPSEVNATAADEAAADIALHPAKKHIAITKQTVLEQVKYFALLVFLAFLRALINYVFILPNGFAPGGIGGISTIIYNAILPTNAHLADTVFEPGLTTFVMNVPLLIAAFFVLNKRFTFNTFCVIGCYSGFTSLFSHVKFPQYYANGDTGLQIIAAILGGVVMGFCLGVMLRYNMSMGGTDIIGKFIHKHNPQAGANWWILMCDCTVAMSSCVLGILKLKGQAVDATTALTAILSPILFSFLSLVVCSIVADVVQSGFQSSLVFTIITDKPNEIGEAIATRLHRGVTISKAIGYYTGIEHEVLVCVVSKKQINIVKSIVSTIDPTAFTYITKAREVAGKGFHSGS